MRKTRPVADRFWEKVRKTENCWLWTGCKNKDGYGQLSVDGQSVGAHRISFALANGSIPEGLEVCHNCPGGDNPACVNPLHLFLGTHQDNGKDMSAKGRAGFQVHPEAVARGDRQGHRKHPEKTARGERHGHSELTEAQVIEIRRLKAETGATNKQIAVQFSIQASTISKIIHRLAWKHI